LRRVFNYSECENITKLFHYLDQQVDDGFIVYKINEVDSSVIIDNLLLEDDDELFKFLLKLDLIEDFEYQNFDDLDDDYDDFYNEDDV
jgi:hypothetical protein